MKTYSFGAKIRVSAIFADSAGTSVDPTTIKFAYIAAAIGAATTLTYPADPALIKDSVGHYHVDIDSNESPGHFDWRFFSTGTNQAAQTGEFYISPNPTVTFIPPASAALLTLPLTVPNGGTGSTSFTTNGVLFGQGTAGISSTAQGGANTVLSANAGAPSFSSAPTLTGLTLTSALSVANGGTGDSTLTTNGVLYGNATNAINVTAQGATNSVLTASAGAPVFSATPTLTGLSLTSVLSVANGGTGDSTLTTNGVLFGNATNAIQITAQGAANSVLIANAGAPSFSATPQLTRLGIGAPADATAQLFVVGDGIQASARVRSASNQANYEFYRSAGTIASPANVSDTEIIGTFRTLAYSGATGFWNVAQINFAVDGAVVDNQRPGASMQFYTNVPNGAQTLRLNIAGTGHITPGADNTQDFGASATRWRTGYFGTSLGVGGAPSTSAALEVASTTGAILIPRMTSTQRDALTAADGMIIYNTTTAKFQGREAGAWNNFSVL